jgi:hypothetical protein
MQVLMGCSLNCIKMPQAFLQIIDGLTDLSFGGGYK